MKNDIFTESYTLAVPNATAANTVIQQRFDLNKSYERAIGYRLYIASTIPASNDFGLGANVDFEIKLEDDNSIFQRFTNWRDFTSDQSVAFEQRNKRFPVEVKGGTAVTLSVRPLQATTKAGIIYFVLDLIKKEDDKKKEEDKAYEKRT